MVKVRCGWNVVVGTTSQRREMESEGSSRQTAELMYKKVAIRLDELDKIAI